MAELRINQHFLTASFSSKYYVLRLLPLLEFGELGFFYSINVNSVFVIVIKEV